MKVVLFPIHIMTTKTLNEKIKKAEDKAKEDKDTFYGALVKNLTKRSVDAEIRLKIRMGSKH